MMVVVVVVMVVEIMMIMKVVVGWIMIEHSWFSEKNEGGDILGDDDGDSGGDDIGNDDDVIALQEEKYVKYVTDLNNMLQRYYNVLRSLNAAEVGKCTEQTS